MENDARSIKETHPPLSLDLVTFTSEEILRGRFKDVEFIRKKTVKMA